jgi:uncharacterized protein (TIGR03000 family)
MSSCRRLAGPLVLAALAAVAAAPLDAHADAAAPPDKALLLVRLPAAAALTIGASPTEQTGVERLFVSPPLEAGKRYRYTLKAEWTENGESRAEERVVVVQAGVQTVAAFGAPKKGAGADDVPPKPAEPPAEVKTRTFQFTYSATVTGLPPGERTRVWVPVAQSTDDQDVIVVAKIAPAEMSVETEKLYGNQVLYTSGPADADGKFGPVEVVYKVTRREVKGDGGKEAKESADLMARYLKPDAKVPIDGKPLELLAGKDLPKDPLGAAKVMYDVIDDTLKYGKDKPGWGNGDSVWACDSKTGNCSDFHSLFISLARSRKIPAKFEIGFPLPTDNTEGEIPGYHCWAKFKPEGSKGWIPVDISEANKNPKLREYYFGNLTADRVALSVGRDLELVPKQDGGPVNFLIYPYVEVDGKEYAKEKVQKKFTFKDEK